MALPTFIQTVSGSTTGTSLTITVTSTPGNCLLVTWRTLGGTAQGGSVADSAGNQYSPIIGLYSDFSQMWVCANAAGVTTVTITITTSSGVEGHVTEYSNVGAIGLSGTISGTSTAPSINLGMSRSTSLMVAQFATAVLTPTANVGTLRGTVSAGTPVEVESIVENSDPTGTGGATCSVTLGSSQAWEACAVELIDPGIGFIRSGNASSATGTDVVVTVAINAKSTVVVNTGINASGNAVSTVIDSGGSVYTKQASIVNNAGTYTFEIWATAAGTAKASSTVTVRYTTSNTSKKNSVVADYSNVTSLGATATSAPVSTSANPTISLTTKDKGNWVVAGSGVGAAKTYVQQTGTLRDQSSQTGGAIWLGDNTSVNPGSVTVSTTYTTAGSNAIAALELRNYAYNRLMLMGVGQ